MYFCIKISTGPRVASCESALKPAPPHAPLSPVVNSTDRSKAVTPVLVLLFVALWFILRGDLFYVLPFVILFLCFFSPFSSAIILLEEERANLSAFRTYARFVLACFYRIPLSLGVWEGRRFVTVALPGRFSYLFCYCIFFSYFSIAITSLGEERANLSAFRTFVRFAFVWCCLFSLPLRVWDGLPHVQIIFHYI